MAKGGQTPVEPMSPRMRAAWKLKEAGDVVAAREAAELILAELSLAEPPAPEDAAQARELLRRSTTPPALYGYALLAAGCFALLVLLATLRY